jgi:hypothetical protein
MKSTSLTEQEASVIREQFGDFMTGRSAEENVLLAASEMTMHTDDHTDNHQDAS